MKNLRKLTKSFRYNKFDRYLVSIKTSPFTIPSKIFYLLDYTNINR